MVECLEQKGYNEYIKGLAAAGPVVPPTQQDTDRISLPWTHAEPANADRTQTESARAPD